MQLYRPTGLQELALLFRNDMRQWPPRLPDQPIFYPVLQQDYARQVARDWNTKYDACAGFVTQFSVDDAYIQQYEVRQVGGQEHKELWIPAEELEHFNSQLTSPIVVLEAYFGKEFLEQSKTSEYHQKQDALYSLWYLIDIANYNFGDFYLHVIKQKEMIFLHYPYWSIVSSNILATLTITEAQREDILKKICWVWERSNYPLLCLHNWQVI